MVGLVLIGFAYMMTCVPVLREERISRDSRNFRERSDSLHIGPGSQRSKTGVPQQEQNELSYFAYVLVRLLFGLDCHQFVYSLPNSLISACYSNMFNQECDELGELYGGLFVPEVRTAEDSVVKFAISRVCSFVCSRQLKYNREELLYSAKEYCERMKLLEWEKLVYGRDQEVGR